ncbi:nucleotide exchange factor Sil1 [Wyeomyia smithii]|uniref:nucleotide exchange factor Sil1 n=1 Tax=Wyeomyia smithii TaxID=174621 RepID=UPI0024680C28|nr:nucleotide exchange factor Sil1 [Wyeomyia smithii]
MQLKAAIFILVGLTTASNGNVNNSSRFVATREWQEIAEGQSIPEGLHVRINLSTGKKEAKLLEKDTNNTQSSLSTVAGADLLDHGTQLPTSNIDKLKEALQNIPADKFELDEKELKKVKANYKTYDQIKQYLKEANLDVKSDGDILKKLIKRFEELHKSKDPTETKVREELDNLFEDLQYLVHQIDNAVEFINYKGIEKIIWPCLNQTESSLRIHGFKLFGTIAQNNPKAKIALFERNGGAILLTKISQTTKSDELSAGLYAFGSLVRKFPHALTELLTPQGYSLLFDVLGKNVGLRVKVKIVRLISDLVQDYEHALSSKEPDPIMKERYQSTNLKESLLKVDYCRRAAEFFHQNKAGLLQDESMSEEVISALRSISPNLCHEVWSGCALFRHTLLVLRNNLDTRLDERSGDSGGAVYLREIQHTIDQFVEELYGRERRKDEL